MKLEPRRVEEFLRNPAGARAALFHGEDVGLVRDRGGRLTRAIAGSLDDPFRVVELDRDAGAWLADEIASLPLTGGRRVVRVRDASDGLLGAVQAALAGSGPGFLVLEAPGLTSRSKLRAAIETAKDAMAVACYPPEGAALGAEIRSVLQLRGVGLDADAASWLEGRLGSDLAVTRAEVEKLALYAGTGGRVDLAAAQACIGDLAGLSLEDALFAATAGDVGMADRSLELALGEGAAPVAVVRAALAHVQRLHRARLAMAEGPSAAEATKATRPPIFFRRAPDFIRALGLWSEVALAAASTRLSDADRACKRTGAPADSICRGAVLGLAQRAAMAQRR